MPVPSQPQLTLDLFRDEQLGFDEFLPGPNAEARAAVMHWSHGEGPACVYLWGAAGCGKSHLLQAAVSAAAADGQRAMYLPLAAVRANGPQVLDGLDQMASLALDDIDVVIGEADWERALFALYNNLTAGGGRLVWAGEGSPATRVFALNDLDSRLRAGLIYQLQQPSDNDKGDILRARARARGLTLPPAVVTFILRHVRRDLVALNALLEALDHASLRDGRALTVPFVRAVLAESVGDEARSKSSPPPA